MANCPTCNAKLVALRSMNIYTCSMPGCKHFHDYRNPERAEYIPIPYKGFKIVHKDISERNR